MSSALNEENLEKKFQTVTNTQDSIQTLSLWILHHKNHHKKIVQIWMKVLKKAKMNHRLVLFYLANDVIQHSKRKGVSQFTESFAEVLKSATLLVRDEKIKHSIERVFKIWDDRNVYDSDFISELHSIIAGSKVRTAAASKLIAEFKPQKVIEKIRKIPKIEEETNAKFAALSSTKIDTTNIEVLRRLKDRSHGQQFSHDFEEAIRCLEAYIKALEKEIAERTEIVSVLEQSEIYYEEQMGEAKQVANAYKSFGIRVKTLQKKLEELLPTLSSPVPSPCPDAPSPTNSDEGPDLSKDDDVNESSKGDEKKMDFRSTFQGDIKAKETPVTFAATHSSFVPQDPGVMTSWLGSFTTNTNSQMISGTSTLDSRISGNSTLERRLSNLMEKIPNLPASVQSTIFGTQSMSGSTPLRDRENDVSSPSVSLKSQAFRLQGEGLMEFNSNNNGTPLKDEDSGQNTPLQDEDAPSSSLSYLSKYTASDKMQLTPKKSNTPSSSTSSTPAAVGLAKPSDKLAASEYGDSQPDIPPALTDILKKLSSTFSSASSPYGPPSWLSALAASNLQDDEDKDKTGRKSPGTSRHLPTNKASQQLPCYTSAPSQHPEMSPVNTDSAKSCRVTSSTQQETGEHKSAQYSTSGEENMEPMDMDLDDSDQEDNATASYQIQTPAAKKSSAISDASKPIRDNDVSTSNPVKSADSTAHPLAPSVPTTVAKSSTASSRKSEPLPPPPPIPTTIAASFQRNLYMDTKPLEPPPMPSFSLTSEGYFGRYAQEQNQKFGSPNVNSPFREPVRNSEQSPTQNAPMNDPKISVTIPQNSISSSAPPQQSKALFPISSYYSSEEKKQTEFSPSVVNEYKAFASQINLRSHRDSSDMHAKKVEDRMNPPQSVSYPFPPQYADRKAEQSKSSQEPSLANKTGGTAASERSPKENALPVYYSDKTSKDAKNGDNQLEDKKTAEQLKSPNSDLRLSEQPAGENNTELAGNEAAKEMSANLSEVQSEAGLQQSDPNIGDDIINPEMNEDQEHNKQHPKLSSAVSVVSTIQTIQSVRSDMSERWWNDSMESWDPHVRQFGRADADQRGFRQDRRGGYGGAAVAGGGEYREYGFERQGVGYNNRFFGRERRPFGNNYGRPPNGRFVNREPRRYYPPRY